MGTSGMSILRRFWRHEDGSSFETLALVLSVIAVFAVGTADLLHYASKKDGVLARFVAGVRLQVAQLGNPDQPLRGGIDYAPTGAMVGLRHTAPLNPCSDTEK
jgi:hypothetical protein